MKKLFLSLCLLLGSFFLVAQELSPVAEVFFALPDEAVINNYTKKDRENLYENVNAGFGWIYCHEVSNLIAIDMDDNYWYVYVKPVKDGTLAMVGPMREETEPKFYIYKNGVAKKTTDYGYKDIIKKSDIFKKNADRIFFSDFTYIEGPEILLLEHHFNVGEEKSPANGYSRNYEYTYYITEYSYWDEKGSKFVRLSDYPLKSNSLKSLYKGFALAINKKNYISALQFIEQSYVKAQWEEMLNCNIEQFILELLLSGAQDSSLYSELKSLESIKKIDIGKDNTSLDLTLTNGKKYKLVLSIEEVIFPDGTYCPFFVGAMG